MLALTACEGKSFAAGARGEGAIHIANLWWIMLIIGIVIYVEVLVLLGIALFRSRNRQSAEALTPIIEPLSNRARNFVVLNGIAIPAIILMVVFGLNLNTLAALSPTRENTALTIEIIGHQWWWEVRYPHHNIVSANEIHIPTGTHVELRLASEDVIHSLWIPELNGKTDLIPGQSNRMFLYTDHAGEYRGQCAELCGLQHTWMALYVIAQPPEEFERWVAQQQEPAPIPGDDVALRGQQIFLGSACVYCHTIRGTSASGFIGPDLTHLASRKTLGAGAVPNTRGNLGGWIVDSQSIKPGNKMPPIYLEGDDLQALLAYLETLQ
jgi:cytochrome c oxidase subunit 2